MPFVTTRRRWPSYYRAADLYLHPARAENFPLADPRSDGVRHAGRGKRVGGIPEIVVDGETGLLVPPATRRPSPASVSALLRCATALRRFSAAGVARVDARFTLDARSKRYLDWYARGLEAAP